MMFILSDSEIFHLRVKIPMSLCLCDKVNYSVSVDVGETELVLAQKNDSTMRYVLGYFLTILSVLALIL
jgi:hypothetical protein